MQLCAKNEYWESAIQQCRSCKIPCTLSEDLCKEFGCDGFTFPVQTSLITSPRSLLTNTHTQESASPGTVGDHIMILGLTAAFCGVTLIVSISICIIGIILIKRRGNNKNEHRRETDDGNSETSIDSGSPLLPLSMEHQKGEGHVPIPREDTPPPGKDVIEPTIKTGEVGPDLGVETGDVPSPVAAQLGVEKEGIHSPERDAVELRDNTEVAPSPRQVAPESSVQIEVAPSPEPVASESSADTEREFTPGQVDPELGVETEGASSPSRASVQTEGVFSPGRVSIKSIDTNIFYLTRSHSDSTYDRVWVESYYGSAPKLNRHTNG